MHLAFSSWLLRFALNYVFVRVKRVREAFQGFAKQEETGPEKQKRNQGQSGSERKSQTPFFSPIALELRCLFFEARNTKHAALVLDRAFTTKIQSAPHAHNRRFSLSMMRASFRCQVHSMFTVIRGGSSWPRLIRSRYSR
jgi:hypothetical protein